MKNYWKYELDKYELDKIWTRQTKQTEKKSILSFEKNFLLTLKYTFLNFKNIHSI